MHFVGLVFKEPLIYEQSAARSVREMLEKRTSHGPRQPLKIEQLHCRPRRKLRKKNPGTSVNLGLS